MNKHKIRLIISIVFSFIMVNSTLIEYPTILTNQNAINRENHIIFESKPVSQDHYLAKDFISFRSQEDIDRIFDWGDYTSSGIMSYTAPVSYNSTESKIQVKVINSSVQEDIIQDSVTGGKSRAEQIQSFILNEDLLLVNLSIYAVGLKDYTTYMEIRNSTYDGPTILSFYYDLLTDGWLNITFQQNLFLSAGNYFLYMSYNTAPNTRAWYRSSDGVNSTETWIKNGDIWETPNWDLSLKAYTSEMISPESVEMEINNEPVINLDSSTGYVELSQNLTGSDVDLVVVANSSISYSYQINASYQRINDIEFNYSFNMNIPNFNLNLDLYDPGMFYENYTVNVTKIMSDYYDLQIFSNDSVISFTIVPNNSIIFHEIADLIVFKSDNYIPNVDITETIYSGSYGSINVTTLQSGNISMEILDENSSLIYENLTYSDGLEEILWSIDTDLSAGMYDILIYYFGNNEIGFFESTMTLVKEASLVSQPITASVLDNLSLECRYFDFYQDAPIEGATINFEMYGLTGDLAFDTSNDGNYTGVLDLDIYSLRPGEYEITYYANKHGYREVVSSNQVVLVKRTVTLELSKSTPEALPGETIIFGINIDDTNDNRDIERPIDISFKIVSMIDNSSEEIIVSEILPGVTSIAEYEWIIPSNLVEGEYDIRIEADNAFYTGILVQTNAILIKIQQPSLAWLYSIISIGAIVLGTGIIIFTERERTRRSIYGIMLLHESGIPMAELFSRSITKYEPMLFSSAIAGVITLIKEITGEKLHVMRIEGGRMNIIKGEHSYLIIFLRKSPLLVRDIMANCNAEIVEKHGEQIAKFKGIFFDIDINEFVQKHFKTSIDIETIENIPKNRNVDKDNRNI